jgi:hypothetical protein
MMYWEARQYGEALRCTETGIIDRRRGEVRNGRSFVLLGIKSIPTGATKHNVQRTFGYHVKYSGSHFPDDGLKEEKVSGVATLRCMTAMPEAV